MTVTSSNRFNAHKLLSYLDRKDVAYGYASPLGRVLRAATYWESFPHSYTVQQVMAAETILSECSDTVVGCLTGELHYDNFKDTKAFVDAIRSARKLV